MSIIRARAHLDPYSPRAVGSWLHSCKKNTNLYNYKIPLLFLLPLPPELRFTMSIGDGLTPPKKCFFICNLVPYIQPTYTYIHKNIYTYCIYNSMYRVNRDKKMTCIYQNRFSFFPAFNNFYFLIISLFKCKHDFILNSSILKVRKLTFSSFSENLSKGSPSLGNFRN